MNGCCMKLYQISSLLPEEQNIDFNSVDQEVVGTKISLYLSIIDNKLDRLIEYLSKLPSNHLNYDIDDYPLLQHAIKVRQKLGKKSSCDINMKIIYHLLLAGADANVASNHLMKDGFHENPLTMSLKQRDVELTILLLQFGAKRLFHLNCKQFLEKQQFTKSELKVFKKSKDGIAKMRALFILGTQDPSSLIYRVPKELVTHILTCAVMRGSNQKKIDAAKDIMQYKICPNNRTNSK